MTLSKSANGGQAVSGPMQLFIPYVREAGEPLGSLNPCCSARFFAEGRFGPDDLLTREMFDTILDRLE